MYQSVVPGYMLMILNSDDRNLVGGFLEVKGISWMEGDTSLFSNYTVNINYVDELCTLTQEEVEEGFYRLLADNVLENEIWVNGTIGGTQYITSVKDYWVAAKEAFKVEDQP